jgi:hypothetical protein
VGLESGWEVRMNLNWDYFIDQCFVMLIVVVFAYILFALYTFAWLR